MPGDNLTRIEAQERKALVSVSSYEISLDLTSGPEIFRSTTRVVFSAKDGASTFIDAITSTVHSVTLNGVSLDPAVVSDGVRIQLDGLQPDNVLEVVADAAYTNTGEGLHRFVDPVDERGLPVLAVRGARQPAGFRRVRAARPQGHVPVHRDRALRRGSSSATHRPQSRRSTATPRPGCSRPPESCQATSPPSWQDRTCLCTTNSPRATAG